MSHSIPKSKTLPINEISTFGGGIQTRVLFKLLISSVQSKPRPLIHTNFWQPIWAKSFHLTLSPYCSLVLTHDSANLEDIYTSHRVLCHQQLWSSLLIVINTGKLGKEKIFFFWFSVTHKISVMWCGRFTQFFLQFSTIKAHTVCEVR